MELVENKPNWIMFDDEDGIPLEVDKWDYDHLQAALDLAIFRLHECTKYGLIYRAEVILRWEGNEVKGQEHLIVEVECPRDGETLRQAGNMETLYYLPYDSFRVYRLTEVVHGS